MITFTVLGTAVPKGSKKAFLPRGWKRPVVVDDNRDGLRPWLSSVMDAAHQALGEAKPLEGPVEVALVFYVARPKSAPKSVTVPATRPDWDKLSRAVGDALKSAGLYRDDGQIARAWVEKRFAAGVADPDGERGIPRLVVRARALQAPTQAPMEQTSLSSLFAHGE